MKSPFTGLRSAYLEFKNFTANGWVMFSICAVALIPLIYAGLFLLAFLDPYGNLVDVPAVVVNYDEGGEVDGEERNIGQELCDALVENNAEREEGQATGFAWDFSATPQEAQAGLEDGSYYMELVIPENFTAAIASADSDDPQSAVLQAYFNPSTNLIAQTVGQSMVTKIKAMLNTKIQEEYFDTIFLSISDAASTLQTAVDGSHELADGLASAVDGNAELTDGITSAHDGSAEITSGLEQLEDGSSTLTDGISSAQDGSAEVTSGLEQLEEGSSTLTDGLKSAKKGAKSLNEGLEDAVSGSGEITSGLGILSTGAASVSEGVDSVGSNLDALAEGVQEGLDSSAELAASMQGVAQLLQAGEYEQAAAAAAQIKSTLDNALGDDLYTYVSALVSDVSTYSTACAEAKTDYAGAVTALNTAAVELQTALQTADLTALPTAAAAMLQALDIFNTLAEAASTVQADKGALEAFLTGASDASATATEGSESILSSVKLLAAAVNGDLSSGAAQVASGAAQLETGSSSLTEGLESAQEGASELAAGITSAAKGSATITYNLGTAAEGSSTLTDGLSDAASGSQQVTDGLTSAASGSSELTDGLSSAASGSEELGDGLTSAASGSEELADGLEDGQEEMAESAADGDAKASMMSEPVQANGSNETGESITQVSNYGTGFAPYFIGLGMWVGCLMITFLIRSLNNRILMSSASSASAVLSSYIPMVGIAWVQVLVLLLFIQFGLGFNVNFVPQYYLFGLLVACCFVAIVQFFRASMGTPGMVVIVVLLMLQLCTAAGTFPIEAELPVFNWLNPFLPMTYVVRGFRMAMCGLSTGYMVQPTAVLAVFTVAFLFLTTLYAHTRRRANMSVLYPKIQMAH